MTAQRRAIGFTTVFLLLFASARASLRGTVEDGRFRVLLDTDANNEVDDQHAIAYMLFNGDAFDVAGITVNRTRGGGDVESQAREAERIVKFPASSSASA